MMKFLSTCKKQTTFPCDQTSSVTETQEDTPKLMDAADSEHTKKSHLWTHKEKSPEFFLAPPIIGSP